MNNPGRLIVVSGPSGAGKSTVIAHLMKRRSDICFSVSATTRPPRKGETDGVDYFFVSRERFEELVRAGAFLEHAEYVGNSYGTPVNYVEAKLAEGLNVILDIEVSGAAEVKRLRPDAVMVFVLPPSSLELERRLRSRHTDSEETIRGRMEQARREYSQAENYDYLVINGSPDTAAGELDAILTAEHCKTGARLKYLSEVYEK